MKKVLPSPLTLLAELPCVCGSGVPMSARGLTEPSGIRIPLYGALSMIEPTTARWTLVFQFSLPFSCARSLWKFSWLLRTYLIQSGMESWGSFPEILPTTNTQLKCHCLQETSGVRSLISSSNPSPHPTIGADAPSPPPYHPTTESKYLSRHMCSFLVCHY